MNKKRIFLSSVLCFFVILVLTGCGSSENEPDEVDKAIIDYAKSVVAIPEVEASSEPVIIPREEYEEKEEKPTQTPEATPESSSAVTQPLASNEEKVTPKINPDDPVMELNIKDYKNVKYDSGRNLQEMEGYFAEGNQEALDDLAHLDRYIAMSFSLRGTKDYIYFGDTNASGLPHGKGIAVFADNQYYYGDWVDGKRQGFGWWEHFHIHLTKKNDDSIIFHQYKGDFKNDLPNGAGQDHYEFDLSKLAENSKTISNYLCNYIDGKIDGEVFCTVINKKNEVFQYQGNAQNGSFEYLDPKRDSKKRGPVIYWVENPDDYVWLSDDENRNIGVIGYISKYKK